MRPQLRFFQVCILLCVMLAGCSGDEESTPESQNPVTITTASNASNEEGEAADRSAEIDPTSVSTPTREELTIASTSPTPPPEATAEAESETETTAEAEEAAAPTADPQNASLQISSELTPLYDSSPLVPNPPGLDAMLDTALEMQPLFAAYANSLDQTQFDLDELNASLNFEAADIVQFVDSQIAFEPYAGILRGSLGTLVSRAGNDVDQALLLQRLLEDAGYETRIAQTTLDAALSEQLINQAINRPTIPGLSDNPEVQAIRGQLIAVSGMQAMGNEGSISAEVSADIDLINNALTAANTPLGAGDLDALIEQASNYFWLQYRLSPFDEWSNAHTAFGRDDLTLTVETNYLGSLPDDMHHRLELSVFVERKEGDQLTAHQMVDTRRANAADLFGKPITFANQPNNADPLTATDVQTILTGSNIFMPVLNGEIAGDAFDLAGRPFDIDLLSLDSIGALPLFQTIANQTEAATGAISALGSDEDAGDSDNIFTLTGQWIEYTQVTPGSERTTTRRYIIDRIGEANRDAGIAKITDGLEQLDAAQQLLTNHTIALLPGGYTPNYAAYRQLSRLSQEGQLLQYIADNPVLDTWPDDIMAAIDPVFDVEAAMVLDSIIPADVIAYRSEPTLIVRQEGMLAGRAEPTQFSRIDIINNTRQVLRVDGDSVVAAPQTALAIGVMETALEPLLLQPIVAGTQRQANSLDTLRDAQAANIGLQVLLPNSADEALALNHSEQTQFSVQRDLEAGYIVIVPEAATANDGTTAWWRVDPTTGETLGVSTGGYGSEFVEYFISLKVGAAFFIIGQATCTAGGGSVGCCAAQNGAALAIGFGLGIPMSFAASFLILDVGLNTLLVMPFVPSFC